MICVIIIPRKYTASPDIVIVGRVAYHFSLITGDRRQDFVHFAGQFVEGWENRDAIAPQNLPTLRGSALVRDIPFFLKIGLFSFFFFLIASRASAESNHSFSKTINIALAEQSSVHC